MNQNQFAQAALKGTLDLHFSPSTMSVQIDTTSAGGLLPGQAVKMVDSLGGIPKVVECSADEDDTWGFINYDLKSKTFEVGDKCEISFGIGNVMYMEAGAAIARGAKLMIVPSGSKVITATSTNMIIGRALDKAVASGDLIRVYIHCPGTLA